MPRSGGKGAGKKKLRVEALSHKAAKRQNIPTAETQSFMAEEERRPKAKLYPRNPDLDPQLVWRGKDEQDAAPLAVDTVPIYIQEKIHPKAIVDDLKRLKQTNGEPQADLFADFNGIAVEDKLEFYRHAQNWSNRMILGDALLVMNSLAEKEKLKGRVQMIYIDPPYGIKFGSNWQASTKARDVKDGKIEDTSREPEVIKAFRDTWELGIHSYLAYLRDRLVVARELLTESGSVFVQIGDENVHLVRSVMDEVFGSSNFCSMITLSKTAGQSAERLAGLCDYLLWYAKEIGAAKFRSVLLPKRMTSDRATVYSWLQDQNGIRRKLTEPEASDVASVPATAAIFAADNITSQRPPGNFPVKFEGKTFVPGRGYWKTGEIGFPRLIAAGRVIRSGASLRYVRFLDDFPALELGNLWTDTGTGSFTEPKLYVVQTGTKIIQRCLLMTTDPGDLVLDPTCGSGTTAYVAEQWGRRWITIDTSRVSLALARTRLMAARFPYYILADTQEGLRKEAEIAGKPPAERATTGDIRRGFVYERVPHITLKSIANNAEIDAIHEKWQRTLEPLRAEINRLCGANWEEWQIPRTLTPTLSRSAGEGAILARRRNSVPSPAPAGEGQGEGLNPATEKLLAQWWEARRERQAAIDASIARNAETEYLYDRPYEDKSIVRVTGPFTVESLSPHRVLPTDEEDDAILDALDEEARERGALRQAQGEELPAPRPKRTRAAPAALRQAQGEDDFVRVVLENLRLSGVQNTKKGEKLAFTELKPWAGSKYVHAEGRYAESGPKGQGVERRAAICIGPEYGTVSYQLVRDAAKEAIDLFDVLVVCGFAFEPHVSDETMSLGRLVVLKARMNQDLHMKELKKTGAGNLFVVFGEPDIDIRALKDGTVQVEIKGVDVFDPTTGEVRASTTDDIACWFIDTDYDEESFFVRHAYFLGARDPYERLKRTLKAEIDEAAWATLYSATSRPFAKPRSGKIAVKVINHYGDEVLKVYRAE